MLKISAAIALVGSLLSAISAAYFRGMTQRRSIDYLAYSKCTDAFETFSIAAVSLLLIGLALLCGSVVPQ